VTLSDVKSPRPMPTIDLTDDEHAAVTALIRRAIEQGRFPLAPRPSRCARPSPSSTTAPKLTPDPPQDGKAKRQARRQLFAYYAAYTLQRGVVVVGRLARPVQARARHAEKRALPPYRQRLVGAVEHRSAVRRARLPDLLAKKSRSTVSWPILACSRAMSRSCAVSSFGPTPGSKARPA